MENLRNLFYLQEYTVNRNVNTIWNEKSYNLFYNLYHVEDFDDNGSHFGEIHHHDPEYSSSSSGSGSGSGSQSSTIETLLIKFVLAGLGISFLTLAGFIGNVLTIIVLVKKKMYSRSINHLLLGLTIADTLFTFCTVFLFAVPNICIFLGVDFTQFYSFMVVPFVYSIGMTAYSASTYFTLVVTIERYMAVAQPIRAKTLCTPGKAVWTSVGVAAFALVYNLPRWWEYSYVALLNHDGVIVEYLPVTTEFRRNELYDRFYVKLGYFVFMYLLPVVVLIVLNILIYRIVRLARKNRSSLTISQQSDNSLTWMLVIVVTVFLCCNSFGIVEGALIQCTKRPSSPTVEAIRNFLIVFNSSVNFIIYCACGETFRAMLLDILPGWMKCCGCCSCWCCCFKLKKKKSEFKTSNNTTVRTIV